MVQKKPSQALEYAKERYAQLGVDIDTALKILKKISLSIHCWQGDDIGGFEVATEGSGGGIQVTGNYPGKPRNMDELQADMVKMLSLVPGDHRIALHAIYGDFGGKTVDRDAVKPEHFSCWAEWGKEHNVKFDFNSTFIFHPKAEDGFTISSKDKNIRDFWIEHGIRSREISAYLGREQGEACIHNLWIPDGMKDTTIDKRGYRELLKEALDRIFHQEYAPRELKDAVESKLFGIASESFVVGSHEFYLSYAMNRNKMICLDMGHFHPTESIADKISAILLFMDELLLHVSRGIRWDSDHIVIMNDDILALCHDIVRGNFLDKVHIGTDFFDATLNRIGAWAVGARSVLKGVLRALLEPTAKLIEYEAHGNYMDRLALLEECKMMPFGIVWDYFCESQEAATEHELLQSVNEYEKSVLLRRSS